MADEHLFAEPASLGVTIFLGIYLVVVFLVLLPVMAILIIRRHHKMLVPRCIPTLVPVLLSQYISAVVFACSIILGKPAFCPALDAFYLLIPVAATHFNLNIPSIVFQNDINEMKSSLAHEGGASKNRSWVNRVMRMFSLPFRLLYMAIIAIVMVCVYLGLRYLAQVPGKLPGDCDRSGQLTYAVLMLGVLISLFYFILKRAKVKDPYFFGLETNLGAVLLLPIMILQVVYPFAPGIFPETFDFRWVIVLMTTASLITDGVLPVLLTNPRFTEWVTKHARGGILDNMDARKELDTMSTIYALSQGVDVFQAVLKNPVLSDAFTQYTVSQWCVENMLFYKAVEDYKVMAASAPANMAGLAGVIVKEYMTTGSALEVNIDFSTKNDIVGAIAAGAITINLFDKAQHHIYKLMEDDTFAQWQRTGEFKETLERVVGAKQGSSSKSVSVKKSNSYSMLERGQTEE